MSQNTEKSRFRVIQRSVLAFVVMSGLLAGCGESESTSSSSQEAGVEDPAMMHGAGDSAGERVATGADIANEPLEVTPGAHMYELSVTGMTCSGCANSISGAIRPMPGVKAVRISLANNMAWVIVEDGSGPEAQAILEAIKTAGYEAEVVKTTPGSEGG